MNKEVVELIRRIEHQPGVEVRENGRGHFNVYKDTTFVATIPQTPSDHRWRENTLADLRRVGITPSVRAKGPKEPDVQKLMEVSEIKARVSSYGVKNADFARFIWQDVGVLQPNMRNFKSFTSAEVAVGRLMREDEPVFSTWVHQLLDASVRAWDQVESRKRLGAEAAERVVNVIVDAPPTVEVDEMHRQVHAMINDSLQEVTETVKLLKETLVIHEAGSAALIARVGRLEQAVQQGAQRSSHPDPKTAYAAALLKRVSQTGDPAPVAMAVLERLDKLVSDV